VNVKIKKNLSQKEVVVDIGTEAIPSESDFFLSKPDDEEREGKLGGNEMWERQKSGLSLSSEIVFSSSSTFLQFCSLLLQVYYERSNG
jgi:hypothetical protein